MYMKDALAALDTFVDPSDHDLDEENSIHAYQTAERIRRIHPLNKELQLVGLIHDLGKVMFTFGEPNWAIVGDTYVVGSEFPKSIVYYETMKENSEKCGLENLNISFGHNEYLYQVLKQNEGKHKISKNT